MDTFIIPALTFFAAWCAIRWRDKVIDSLAPKIEAPIIGIGVAMFVIGLTYPFWKGWGDIWVLSLLIVVFIIATVIYYKAVSDPKKLKPNHDNTLTEKICKFVAQYETEKPSFHGIDKDTHLKTSEAHEKKHVAKFNLEILPLISRNGITIPEYKISQRRWSEIRNLVLEHERKTKDKSKSTASPIQ